MQENFANCDCPTDINIFTNMTEFPKKHYEFGYNGGSMIPNISFYPIYWQLDASRPVIERAKLNYFYEDIVDSSFMIAISDTFSVTNQHIGTGQFDKTFNFIYNNPTSVITDKFIRVKLREWVNSNPLFPLPNRNTYFSIHFGPGIKVIQDEEDSAEPVCKKWCAYHDAIDLRCDTSQSIIQYGVTIDTSSDYCQEQCVQRKPNPLNTCSGWNSTTFDIQTILASHEIAEVITNPYEDGWYGRLSLLENADYCKGISFFTSDTARLATLKNKDGSQCHNSHKSRVSTDPTWQNPRYAVQQFLSHLDDKCIADTSIMMKPKKDKKKSLCDVDDTTPATHKPPKTPKRRSARPIPDPKKNKNKNKAQPLATTAESYPSVPTYTTTDATAFSRCFNTL